VGHVALDPALHEDAAIARGLPIIGQARPKEILIVRVGLDGGNAAMPCACNHGLRKALIV
jgi:hypothetical protein